MGSCTSDRGGRLGHGICLSSQAGQNSCGHLTAGGNAFFGRAGKDSQQAARLFFPDGDYKVYLSSEQPEEEIMATGNPLNEELRQELLSVDGVRDVLAARRSLHGKFRISESEEAGMCDMLTDSNRMDVEAALVSGAMPIWMSGPLWS